MRYGLKKLYKGNRKKLEENVTIQLFKKMWGHSEGHYAFYYILKSAVLPFPNIQYFRKHFIFKGFHYS